MAKAIRSIKADLCDDETLGALPRDVRYMFVGLITRSDDHGRFRANPALVRSRIFPYDVDVTPELVEDWLAHLKDAGRIRLYVCDGQSYGELVNWSKHQRIDNAAKSEIPPFTEGCGDRPPPAASCGEPPLEGIGGEGMGVESAEAAPPPPAAVAQGAPPRTRGSRIPDGFDVNEAMADWAETECPLVEPIMRETQQFYDYWKAASGKTAVKLDWGRAWKVWMRKAQIDAERRQRGSRQAELRR